MLKMKKAFIYTIFLNYFFIGNTIEESYKKSLASRLNIEFIKDYSYNPKYNVSISSSQTYGTATYTHTSWVNGVKTTTTEEVPESKGYDTGFVGKSNFKFTVLKNLTL